ncbi:MAG: gamma-glutamylcyclotransferase [Pseudomonadales bacterium]|nr:gamma-glutamylcyclotransferase [Pseudomonadales bacterium]MCP5184834.1 gamma-glutamylcyclotransferase [Pseudomonadales bacterium]
MSWHGPNRYFAYGSNMNTARVRERGLVVVAVMAARLPSYELLFDKVARDHAHIGHANIAPAHGSTVEGVLYELASEVEILKMDRFESTPVNYSREVVAVQTAEGPLAAWTYIANRAVRHSGRRPSRAYVAHLLEGAPYLSPDYLARLRALEVHDA